MKKKEKSIPINKLPSFLVKLFVAFLLVIALISFLNKMIEYREIEAENKRLREIVENRSIEIDELEYLLNSDINKEYKERMARFLGFCYPDETVYYFE